MPLVDLALETVTGLIAQIDGTARAGDRVTFTLYPGSSIPGVVVPSGRKTAIIGPTGEIGLKVAGVFVAGVPLWANAEGDASSEIRVQLPSGEVRYFILTEGGETDLAALINLYAGPSDPSFGSLRAYVDTHLGGRTLSNVPVPAADAAYRWDGNSWEPVTVYSKSEVDTALAAIIATQALPITYARLPTGSSGSWDVGVGNTMTFTRAVNVSGNLRIGTPTADQLTILGRDGAEPLTVTGTRGSLLLMTGVDQTDFVGIYISSQDGTPTLPSGGSQKTLMIRLCTRQPSYQFPLGLFEINAGSPSETMFILKPEHVPPTPFIGWMVEFQQHGTGSQDPQSVFDAEGKYGPGYRWSSTANANAQMPGDVHIDATHGSANGAATHVRGIMSSVHYNGIEAARYFCRKSRGSHVNPEITATGDGIGEIFFQAHDGTSSGGGVANYIDGAAIKVVTTGTIGANRIPTRMSFWTGTDASPTVVTERMSIGPDGTITFAGPLTGITTLATSGLATLATLTVSGASTLAAMSATTGAFSAAVTFASTARLANNVSLLGRNAANAADVGLIKLDASDRVQVGAASIVMIGAPATTSAASAGDLVLANAKGIRGARNDGSNTVEMISFSTNDQVFFWNGASSVTTTGEYRIGGIRVVTTRKTGWGAAATGGVRAALTAGSSQAAHNDALRALLADLHETAGHGLIGT